MVCPIVDKLCTNNSTYKLILRKTSLATILIIFMIVLINIPQMFGIPETRAWRLCACNRSAVINGEYWRLLTYYIPHKGIQHIVEDVIYLIVVSTFAKEVIGDIYVFITFIACVIVGSIVFMIGDNRYDSLVGSSAGTHGLLACVSCYLLLTTQLTGLRIISIITVLYLIFTSFWAIKYGVMAWPLGTLPNAGYDHLGGVGMGIMIGYILHMRLKNENKS